MMSYKVPPAKSQFKPGQSGNPRGRPRKTENLDGTLRKVLDRKVTFKKDGEKKKLTIREGLVHKLVELSISGDPNAMDWL
ncbi:MAG: DUF5681 domain-containing protein, partial [Pseudomonadota bacterium]